MSAQSVVIVEQKPTSALTPMDMLNQAVAKGADISVLEKLMGLQERWEAGQARKAFDEAVAAAKAKIPPIQRNATGHNSKRYADFSAIARVVDPILGDNGLSYRFRTHQDDTRISVTCVLSHKAGHSEETTLSGPVDTTGNKNPIQAIGSTLTYLQRYSLVQMLGLAASNDDDGHSAGTGTAITPTQLKELEALIVEVNANPANVCRACKPPVNSLAEMTSSQFEKAMAKLATMRAPL